MAAAAAAVRRQQWQQGVGFHGLGCAAGNGKASGGGVFFFSTNLMMSVHLHSARREDCLPCCLLICGCVPHKHLQHSLEKFGRRFLDHFEHKIVINTGDCFEMGSASCLQCRNRHGQRLYPWIARTCFGNSCEKHSGTIPKQMR